VLWRALKDSGMSQRKIAKATGVSAMQVNRDLGGPKGTKSGPKGATKRAEGRIVPIKT
jgi:hypothetical protein